jgi:hypothetical protein
MCYGDEMFFGKRIGDDAYTLSYWMILVRNTLVSGITFYFSIRVNRRENSRLKTLKDNTMAQH